MSRSRSGKSAGWLNFAEGVEEVDEPAWGRGKVGVGEGEKLVPFINGAIGMDRWRRNNIIEFISIKPLVAMASTARESYAAHSRLP
jgi:hypothetical protein